MRTRMQDMTSPELERAAAQRPLSIYCGFDPTAESLHLGNLIGHPRPVLVQPARPVPNPTSTIPLTLVLTLNLALTVPVEGSAPAMPASARSCRTLS